MLLNFMLYNSCQFPEVTEPLLFQTLDNLVSLFLSSSVLLVSTKQKSEILDSLNDLQRSFPSDVRTDTRNISTNAAPTATPSLIEMSCSISPNIFCMSALFARNIVIKTLVTRKMLAHRGWGDVFINCWSLRQRRRQVEKKGSKHPLNT